MTRAAADGARAGVAGAWPLLCAELVGTALLVGAGGSVVILDLGAGSPVAALVPGLAARRALTGFLFGAVGALVAVSPVGKLSGAHVNPAVTLAFWIRRRMRAGVAAGYVAAQLSGGILGALALRAWGSMGASVSYAATLPGSGGPWAAAAGEAGATFCLVAALLAFVGRPGLRRWTPAMFPVLYALLVWAEAPLSGASTNPARSLGPGLVAGALDGWWAYWLGPLAGTLAAAAIPRAPWARSLEIRVAKVFHFEHDRFGFFAEGGRPAGARRITGPAAQVRGARRRRSAPSSRGRIRR